MDCPRCQGFVIEIIELDEESESFESLRCLNCGYRKTTQPVGKHIPTQRGGQANNASYFR